MDLLGDNFCDCKETQVCGVRFPPPKFHSCDYVRARNALIPQAKAEGVKYIIIEPNRPRRTPEYVADAVGAKLVLLPGLVGGAEHVDNYFELFDYDIAQITRGR